MSFEPGDMLALLTQAGFDMTCIVPYYKGLFLVIEAQTSSFRLHHQHKPAVMPRFSP